jgi:hypothetical protein
MHVYNSHRRGDDQLILSHRLYKLYARHVSSPFSVLSWVLLLTVSAVRLNSRDYVRDRRSNTDNPENAIHLSSIRIEPLSEAYESKSRQPGTVHHSTTLNFGRNKSDHDLGATFEIQKAV